MKAAQLADVRRALYDQKLADALALNAQRLADLSAGLKGAGQMALSRTGNFGSVVQSGIQGAEAGADRRRGHGERRPAHPHEGLRDAREPAREHPGASGAGLRAAHAAIGPAVSRIVAAAGMIIEQAIPALQPVFDTLGSVLNSLTFFVLLGQVFKVLAPVIKALLESLMVIFKIIQPILKPLFDVAKVVLTLVLGIVKGVLDIWNAIIEGDRQRHRYGGVDHHARRSEARRRLRPRGRGRHEGHGRRARRALEAHLGRCPSDSRAHGGHRRSDRERAEVRRGPRECAAGLQDRNRPVRGRRRRLVGRGLERGLRSRGKSSAAARRQAFLARQPLRRSDHRGATSEGSPWPTS